MALYGLKVQQACQKCKFALLGHVIVSAMVLSSSPNHIDSNWCNYIICINSAPRHLILISVSSNFIKCPWHIQSVHSYSFAAEAQYLLFQKQVVSLFYIEIIGLLLRKK